MNCRQFNKQVADFASGRLSSDTAARMALHRDSCPACARLDADERSLRSSWSAMPEPRLEIPLWARIATQIEAPPAPVRRPRFRPVFAYAGTLAVGAAVAFMLFRGPSVPLGDPEPGADIVKVAQVFNTIHTPPDPATDVAADATSDFGRAQQLVLIGGVR